MSQTAGDTNSIILSANAWQEIQGALNESVRTGRETCRFLVGAQHGSRAVVDHATVSSTTTATASSFSVSVCELTEAGALARVAGMRLVGIVHTHLAGYARPSLQDLDLTRTTGLYLMIAAISSDGTIRLACFESKGKRIWPVPIQVVPDVG